jgi:hypothetical protein
MTGTPTDPQFWPLDENHPLPAEHQRAAWRALADARELLAGIAATCTILADTAFDGQAAARTAAGQLHGVLLELEVALGQKGVLNFGIASRGA